MPKVVKEKDRRRGAKEGPRLEKHGKDGKFEAVLDRPALLAGKSCLVSFCRQAFMELFEPGLLPHLGLLYHSQRMKTTLTLLFYTPGLMLKTPENLTNSGGYSVLVVCAHCTDYQEYLP